MADYYLTPMEDVINPKFSFYLLYRDGKSFFVDFVDSLKQKSDLAELDKVWALMDKVDNNNLPVTKFRHINSGSRSGRRNDIYEFKSKHLRVYVIKKSPDFYVVLAGFKKNQEKDVAKIFRYFDDLPDDLPVKYPLQID